MLLILDSPRLSHSTSSPSERDLPNLKERPTGLDRETLDEVTRRGRPRGTAFRRPSPLGHVLKDNRTVHIHTHGHVHAHGHALQAYGEDEIDVPVADAAPEDAW
jgi:hypothetical protein